MAVRVEINGTVVEFDRPPSPEDVDAAAAQLKLPKQAPADDGTSFVQEALATGVEVAGPVLGGMGGAALGTLVAPGAGTILGGTGGAATGGAIAGVIADKIRGKETTLGGVAADAAVSALPGGYASKIGGGIVKRTFLHAVEGAVQGELSQEIGKRLEEGRAPTNEERLQGATMGAGVGGFLGAALGRRKPVVGGAVDEALTREQAPGFTPDENPFSDLPIGYRAIDLPGDPPKHAPVSFGPDGEPIIPLERADLTPGPASGAKTVVGMEGGAPTESNVSVQTMDALRDDFKAKAVAAVDTLKGMAHSDDAVHAQQVQKIVKGMILSDMFDPEETARLLARNNETLQDFFGGPNGIGSQSAKVLNRLSQIKRALVEASESDPELRKMLDASSVAAKESGWYWLNEIRDLDDVGRTTAIGQIATGQRNGITQAGRLLLEVPTDIVKAGLSKAGVNGARGFGGDVGNPLATIVGMARALKPGDTDRWLKFLEAHGGAGRATARDLFGSHSFEGSISQSKLGHPLSGLAQTMAQTAREGGQEGRVIKTVLGPFADALSAFNQVHEGFARRAAMHARLLQLAEKRGLSWADVVNDPKLLTTDDLENGLNHALELSFAKEPEGAFGRNFVHAVKMMQPISTVVIPYPRYMTNFGKFFMDFNPLGMLRLFNAGTRNERGLDVLSRGLVGSMLLGAGYAIRTRDDMAGEKWTQLKTEDGKRTDVTGLAGPFLPYLFLGELMAQETHGTEGRRPLSREDWLQGIAGMRLSPGTRALVDYVFPRKGNEMSTSDFFQKTVGESMARFTVPLRTIKDFAAAYGNDSEAVYYDPREPFGTTGTLLNSTIQNVPELGAAYDRPPSVNAMTGKERVSIDGAQRQLLGITNSEVTPVEQELTRLGFEDYDLAPRTGIPKLDRELARRTGPIAQALLPKLFASEEYQNVPYDADRRKLIREVGKEIRQLARDHLAETNPGLAAMNKLKNKLSPDKERLAVRGIDVKELLRKLVARVPGR
jgi:predicted nucleic acid-binding Zn ribbon protein